MVSIIFAIIEAFLLHFTIALFYDKKYGSIVSFMSLVLLILFNIFIVIYSPQYKLFICMGAYLCYSLAFNARAGYRAFMVMIYMTLITISEFIVMGMLNIVMPDKWSMYKMPAMFAAYIIYFGLVFTFYKFFKINFKRMPYKYIIAITVTVLLFFLSLEMMSGVVFTSTKEIRLYFSVIGIVLFMAIIILAYIFSSLCGYYNLYIESREETMVSNMIKSYYEGIEKNN